MKRLVIAEKPSLAATVCKAIEKSTHDTFKKQDGYFENGEYIVSFAFGHLFGLLDLEEYSLDNSEKKFWDINDIPFVPQNFMFKLKDNKGIKDQYNTLKSLMLRKDVEDVIHCGDADREGEVIIRLIVEHIFEECSLQKPVLRLWLPDQSDTTIINQLKEMKTDRLYDNLYNEGLARTYIDWTYGINFTRLLTIKYGETMPVGRVLVPIVKEIYDRCYSIENFVKSKYLQAENRTKFGDTEIVLTHEKKFSSDERNKANELCENLNSHKAVIKSIEKKDVHKSPGKLFSLTKLQNKLSKAYKMSMNESLCIIQGLYEKGFITYPRTNTEYLAISEKDKVQSIINLLNNNGYSLLFKDSKAIFDDSKIESHSAITPTLKMPLKNNLSSKEQLVYDEILTRFVCVFLAEDAIIEKTSIKINVGDAEFKITGEAIKQQGFLKYEPQKEKFLPSFNVGDEFNVEFKIVTKETSPPAKHTVSSLNSFLEAPFKTELRETDEVINDDEEYKAILQGLEIGTVSSRTSIIENAKNYGYISENKGVYDILPKGQKLIELLDKLGINLYKKQSVKLSKILKAVYKEEISVDDVSDTLKSEVTAMINSAKNIECEKSKDTVKEVIGICPKCGKPVFEGQKSYYCSGYKEGCNFSLWKSNKFFEALGKNLDKRTAVSLLKNKRAYISGLKSKAGNKFNAIIEVEWIEPYPRFQLVFETNKKKKVFK